MNETTPVQYEYKHSCYCLANDRQSDAVIVKRNKILPDGTVIPEMAVHENVKRSFWITKPGFRKHKDKTEWEKIERLQEFKTTQREMAKRIQKALGRSPMDLPLKQIYRSPYVYGCDIDITGLVSNHYRTTWPQAVTGTLTKAVLDIETDVLHGSDEIIACSVTYKDKVFCAVTKKYCEGVSNPLEVFQKDIDKYIGEELKERGAVAELYLADNPGEAAYQCIQKLHQWKPDTVLVWNINFDLPIIIEALKKDGFDLADTFSDPSVPYKYRYFRWAPGQTKKVKRTKVTPIPASEQWHTLYAPASFYFLDAMSVYRILRRVEGQLPSYGLEAITNLELGEGKLKFHDPNYPMITEGSLDWHRLMQSKHKGVYVAYNIIDCIRVEQVDEKTKDIEIKIGTLMGSSHFSTFNSNPRRICDSLHWFLKDKGYIIATTSDQMSDELDKHVVEMDDWIVTLASSQIEDIGTQLITDYNYRNSMLYAHASDLDIVSTYPTVTMVLNISKETTRCELSRIEGLTMDEQRSLGVNLTGGPVNAMLLGQRVFKLKRPHELLELFKQEHNLEPA